MGERINWETDWHTHINFLRALCISIVYHSPICSVQFRGFSIFTDLYDQYHNWRMFLTITGFPDSLVGKEPACNAGDSGSIPGSGTSTGKGIGYPFQYSWASLVAQLVKNLPAMQETWARSLGWEDPLEKGMVGHPLQYSCWRIPWTEEPGWL